MATATYYPTGPRRRGKKEGGRPPVNWADKFGKYFSEEFIKQGLPFGKNLVLYYKYAEDFTGKVKKEIKTNVASYIFYSSLGPAFKENPLYGLYQLSQNAPKTVFYFVKDNLVEGGWWYKRLGYEKHSAVARMEKVFDERTGRAVTRLQKNRWKVPQVTTVWTPRDHFRLGPLRFAGDGGKALAGAFRTVDAVVNPFNWLRGDTFLYFGWERGHFDAAGNFAPKPNFKPRVEGLENIDYKTILGPGTAKNIPFISPAARGLTVARAYLFGDLDTLQKVGWGRAQKAIVEDHVYKRPILERALSFGEGKYGVRNYYRSIPNPGRLGKVCRVLRYANPYYLVPNIVTGKAFTDWGWFEEVLKPGQLPGLIGPGAQPYEGALPGGGSIRILKDEAGVYAGQICGAIHRSTDRGRRIVTIAGRNLHVRDVGRLLHYLHPRQLLLSGETLKMLGWIPNIVPVGPPTFGQTIAWGGRGGRFGRLGRVLYYAHPASYFSRDFSIFRNRLAPYLRSKNLYQGAAKQLKAGKALVDTAFDNVKKWFLGTTVGAGAATLGARILARFPFLRQLLLNPLLKFVGKAALESLKWLISPSAQIISYTFRSLRGAFRIVKDIIKYRHKLGKYFRVRRYLFKRRFRGLRDVLRVLGRVGRGAFNLLRSGATRLLSQLGAQISGAAIRSAATSALAALQGFIVNTVVPAIVSAATAVAGSALTTLGGVIVGIAGAIGIPAGVIAVVGGIVLGVIIFFAFFFLNLVLPTSLKVWGGEGLGTGVVTIEKVAKVEANEKYQADKIGKNYLEVDNNEHTVEYILTVKNNSEAMKIVSLTATDDFGTPSDHTDDLALSFPNLNIAPGASFELKRYGKQITADSSKNIIDKVEGAASLVGVEDPSETSTASFSDVGVFMILGAGVAPDPGLPCGWPATGKITTIFNQDMEKTGVKTPEKKHSGVDIAATDPTSDQSVYSTLHGFLAASYWSADSGGIIKIKHPSGSFYVDFIHMSETTATDPSNTIGKEFALGDLVGQTHIGTLTYSSGTHLHYRVRMRTTAGVYENVDPMDYASRKSINDTVAAGADCALWPTTP